MKRSPGIIVILFSLATLLTPGYVFGASQPESHGTAKSSNLALVDEAVASLATVEAMALDSPDEAALVADKLLPNHEFDTSSDTSISLAPAGCSTASSEQPLDIPDDGSWIHVCYSDSHAPPKGTVTEVHVKYVLDHPDPSELEIQVTRSDTKTIQVLWGRGTSAKGTELGKARGIQTFKGFKAQGEWRLQIRDTVPGKKGYLKAFTVRADYAPTGPLPIQKAGSPAKPGSLYLPQGTVDSKTPDRNPSKPAGPPPQSNKSSTRLPAVPQRNESAATSSWQTIKNETFEGAFPNCGGAFAGACWTRSSDASDGKEYLWDDDDWKPHPHPNCEWDPSDCSFWAAWPAADGADQRDPETATYAPNMYSWMAYGPFDLRAGTSAQVNFWLWREIEETYDKVGFFISTDGANWTPFWWDTTNPNWEQEVFDLTPYVGNATIWVGWLFWSDSSTEYQGPWIDDVNIVILPGEVKARGDLHFFDRVDNVLPAQGLNVYLYDRNGDGSLRELQRSTTQANGSFEFVPEMNWDTDTVEADRRLDLIVAWETDTSNRQVPRRATLHTNGQTYRWVSGRIDNVANGTGPADFYGFQIANDTTEERAVWIFDDLRRGWEFVRSQTNPSVDPGGSIAYWEQGVSDFGLCRPGSCFYPGVSGPGWPAGPWIFIHTLSAPSHDTPQHELGHHYMWRATGGWWNASWNCWPHTMWASINAGCAWSEGWANFFAVAVNNDPRYDNENLETATWGDGRAQGDTVEGRVAGGMWDLFDTANDGFDEVGFGFAPIWTVMSAPPGRDNFRAFWDKWVANGYNRHWAVRAIYQNTVDYDALPVLNVPSQMLLWNRSLTIDLWPYASDFETSVGVLTFPGIRASDARCGASLTPPNSHFVNLRPQANWSGVCTVWVDVNDTMKTATGSFIVQVVRWGTFLPITVK